MSVHGDRSFGARRVIEISQLCGCYYCVNLFYPSDIKEWVSDIPGDTAICPKCGIDSVVPYNEAMDGEPEEFLNKLLTWQEESFK